MAEDLYIVERKIADKRGCYSRPCEVVDEIRKNISGSGMDYNIIGRFSTPHMKMR